MCISTKNVLKNNISKRNGDIFFQPRIYFSIIFHPAIHSTYFLQNSHLPLATGIPLILVAKIRISFESQILFQINPFSENSSESQYCFKSIFSLKTPPNHHYFFKIIAQLSIIFPNNFLIKMNP